MQPKREFIPASLRKAVLERDRYRCRYCGAKGEDGAKLALDHIYPFSRGGETTFDNLATACQRCNSVKHNKVGFWPRPVDYFFLRDFVYDIQVGTAEMLVDLRFFVIAHMRQLYKNEEKTSLWDLGRVCLRHNLDLLEACRAIDAQLNPKDAIIKTVRKVGVKGFLERSREYDRRCKVSILTDQQQGNFKTGTSQ